MKFILIHIFLFALACLVTFALIPLDQMYFSKVPVEEIKKYYNDAFTFASMDAWKTLFTWFLGLSCGRLMVKALLMK